MTKKGQDLEMYAGDDKITRVTVYDPDDVIIDITDCTIRWVWYKRYPYSLSLDKSTSSGSGIILTDPTNGIFELTLVPEDTENLLGDYNHECELTDTDNKISTILTGHTKILASRA
jgi:hypothetical protein